MACVKDNAKLVLDPSELRHSIDVQARVEVDDAFGGQTITWPTSHPGVWMSVEMLDGAEPVQHDQLAEVATHLFRCRFVDASGVTVKHRFLFRGELYNILSVDNVEFRDRVLEFHARRGVTQ
jgi:SPP1 family predicted phage head-tail adaptor